MTPTLRGQQGAEALARRFHEAYERLAPQFGYETRQETRAFDPTTANGRLMVAVCAELSAPAAPEAGEPQAAFNDPRVQAVYEILCDTDSEPPPAEQHWEGWTARRIVDALAAPGATHTDEAGQAAAHVGDTRFEGWLSEHAITDVHGSKLPVYHKQDMRDAYWAGYMERATPPSAAQAEGAEPDRDLALTLWHKHCRPHYEECGHHPFYYEIDAMMEFAALTAAPAKVEAPHQKAAQSEQDLRAADLHAAKVAWARHMGHHESQTCQLCADETTPPSPQQAAQGWDQSDPYCDGGSREAFESWIAKRDKPFTNWELWQAARAAQGERAGAGLTEWVPMHERAPEPDTDCVVLLRYTLDRPPFLGLDRWQMQCEDPTGMGGPTMETGYGWNDNFEGDVIAWAAIRNVPPESWDQRLPGIGTTEGAAPGGDGS